MWQLTSIPENVDAYFSLWRIAWIAHQLPRDVVHLFDANIFHPLRHTLAYSDAVLLEGWRVRLDLDGHFRRCCLQPARGGQLRELWGGDVPAGQASHGTCRRQGDQWPRLRFRTVPVRHYFHSSCCGAQWIPLTLWMTHRTSSRPPARRPLTGLFVALQGLSSIYYVILTSSRCSSPSCLASCWTAAGNRRAPRSLAAGAVLTVCLLGPYMLPYRAARRSSATEPGRPFPLQRGSKALFAAMPESLL